MMGVDNKEEVNLLDPKDNFRIGNRSTKSVQKTSRERLEKNRFSPKLRAKRRLKRNTHAFMHARTRTHFYANLIHYLQTQPLRLVKCQMWPAKTAHGKLCNGFLRSQRVVNKIHIFQFNVYIYTEELLPPGFIKAVIPISDRSVIAPFCIVDVSPGKVASDNLGVLGAF